jgi:phosphate:Na+ symporter
MIAPSFLLASSAAGSSGKEISWFLMVTGLFGGMGMFLYGMEMMSDGMKIAAGNKMRTVLEKLTSNRFLAVGVGAFVTMVIQSSSATTVMLVSFVNSGLLSFVQGLGVILGSNIGSTVTAQIVAFKVTDYALALIAVGAIMALFSKKGSTKNIGFVILGFGLLFY